MAARIRLFISIKSQSVQIRRCNIGRGGRSCLVFENPFVQFGKGGWFLCLPTQGPKIDFFPQDWLPIRICIFFALANLWIWASSSALKKMWFHWTSSFFRRQVSALTEKSIFLALQNIQNRIWFWLCFLIQEAKVSITWQAPPKSARACTWPRSRWTSWQTQGWQWSSSLGFGWPCLQIWERSTQI